eukprot:606511-Pelagomonas_calceolata.AAC.4
MPQDSSNCTAASHSCRMWGLDSTAVRNTSRPLSALPHDCTCTDRQKTNQHLASLVCITTRLHISRQATKYTTCFNTSATGVQAL